MISDNFVGALAIMLIFGAPITAWVISRVLAHQERIEMIRRGMIPPPHGRYTGPIPPPPVWGQGPTVPPPPPPSAKQMPYRGYEDYYSAQCQMRKGVKVTLIGFAILLGLGTIGSFNDHYFGPWLLGGLVPMFVGIAQIISAAMNGAQMPFFGAGYGQAQHFGPPPQTPPQPPGAAPPPPSGPYAWRPGPTPEIERHDK